MYIWKIDRLQTHYAKMQGQFNIEGKVGLNLIGEYIKILRGKGTAWKKERINR